MTESDRSVTAGWVPAGKGRGGAGARAHRHAAFAPDEAATARQSALLGAETHDVFLNADAYWRNIPGEVWTFTIDGYQVLKKWLSYRERPLLGRALTASEVRYVRDVARRLAALRPMALAFDANYRACTAAHRPFGHGAG